MSKDAISFSFCISENYAQHLAVVIASILVNNPDEDFVFHVVHHSVSPGTEGKLRELEKAYPHHRIVFHRIDADAFARFPIPRTLAHVTREMYYRYLLPELLSDERRTIYSDVDVLCVKGGLVTNPKRRARWQHKSRFRGASRIDNPYHNSIHKVVHNPNDVSVCRRNELLA